MSITPPARSIPNFAIAEQYGFANRMFQTNQGPSFPAHLFLFSGTSSPGAESPLFVAENPILHEQPSGCIAPAGQTVKLIDGYGDESSNPPIVPCVDHRTLGDLFDAAGIDWRYYTPTPGSIWTAPDAFKHICGATIVNGHGVCQGQIWTAHVVANNPAQVLTDTANCDLAPLSWVIPDRAESDHATETDGSGPAWVASVVNAVGNQPTCPRGENYWQDTAIVITWDDWGGWFDHVPPPAVQVQPYSPAAWGDGYVYGFRLPMMVVSAYTPAGLVDNQMHDFGGILNFVEENFGLGTIGPGNSLYANYADFQARKRGDSLAGFFPLSTARAFAPIPSPLPPSFFLDQKGPFYGPDGD
jgi:phospholipase C